MLLSIEMHFDFYNWHLPCFMLLSIAMRFDFYIVVVIVILLASCCCQCTHLHGIFHAMQSFISVWRIPPAKQVWQQSKLEKHQCSRSTVEMAGENADVNMVAGVDDNMDGAPMVDDHEDEGSEVDFQGLEGESDRTSQCTTLELGAEEPGDKGPKVQWEYTFLPIKDPEASINNIELGGKANLYHRTWEGNSSRLAAHKDVWLNITGIGNSSHKYEFVKAIFLAVPQAEYLHYKCSSGRFKDVCFRQVPGCKPVSWDHFYSDDGKLVAVQFYYALSGRPLKVVILGRTSSPTAWLVRIREADSRSSSPHCLWTSLWGSRIMVEAVSLAACEKPCFWKLKGLERWIDTCSTTKLVPCDINNLDVWVNLEVWVNHWCLQALVCWKNLEAESLFVYFSRWHYILYIYILYLYRWETHIHRLRGFKSR